MAYKARCVKGYTNVKTEMGDELREIPGLVAWRRGKAVAGTKTVGRVTYTGKQQLFPGEPPEAALTDPDIFLSTLKGRPWPGSVLDMECSRSPERAKPRKDGKESVNPGYMLRMKQRGDWPDAEEKALQAFAEAKLRDPERVARELCEARGITGKDANIAVANAVRAVRGGVATDSVPRLAAVAETLKDARAKEKPAA